MTEMDTPLELRQVLANARGDAAVLRRAGNEGQAEYIEKLCDSVKESAEDYMTWLEESDAKLRSGWTDRTARRRFGELQECGLARWLDGRRQFKMCAVPPRSSPEEQKARGVQVVSR